MATRVSPRSNASSASSSSSAPVRTYRNTSFNRDRDNLEPQVRSGRGGRQAKQQHLHQQCNKGHWGHKSNQAGGPRGSSGTEIAGKNQEISLSWRSQKQAIDNCSTYLDSGPPKGGQHSFRSYGPSPFPLQGQPALRTAEGYRNEGTRQELNFYSEQRKPAFISEQSPQERHQPNFTNEDYHIPGKITTGYNSKASNTYTASNINQTQWSRGPAAKFHQGFKDNSLNPSHGSGGFASHTSQGHGGYSANFSQGSRCTSGNSSWESGNESADVTNRGWNAMMTRGNEGNFCPSINRGEAGARSGQRVGTSSSATSQVWGGVNAVIGSWADECGDDASPKWSKDKVGARISPIIVNSYKIDLENSDVQGIRRPNANNNNKYRGPVSGVSNRDAWQQNSWRGSNVALEGDGAQSMSRSSWRNQESGVKQGEAGRNTTFPGQHGSFKCIPSVDSEQRAGGGQKSGPSSQNPIHHVRCEIREESVRISDDEFSVDGHAEVLDDVILPFIMGTCEDMCPVKEREQRERLRDLAVFERANGNPGKTSRELAVKKFCRTFSGVKLLAADIRPMRILWSTLQYLLSFLDDSEFSFDIVHNFLFDRTRAIRQELGMQRIANSQAINMYEEIVRFHILSEHELNKRGSGRQVSDSHLNLQQLSKSLLSLFDLYHLNHHEKLANEAEFRAYYVLLNLDSNSHHQADSLSVWFRQCPALLLNAWEIKFARTVLRCYRSGNYRNFFQLAHEATFLQSCLMELHFNKVRLKGLAAMNQGGYKLHPIPLRDIAKQLLIKEGDLEELCNLCGLSTGMDSSRVRNLLVKQSQFSAPKELPSYRCACIINKQPSSYYEEVTGTNRRLGRV